ncbi:MAG TPA: NAD-dependent epimerase/dehydratase family protein [Aliidongia sp.]|uniref:NAD-dependent epimerase/dehydratase family protein n=1 Tax=Aliidongia sp. TaxID=1914230 RepID=UPI002DDCDC08|nr:NAD-dependent epimerase/dehydratase family protein [Aliidongia sp.]HEV2678233.1 NAD-dependent epimerase/dehydratase family protein [Aliidongia sp.]
MSKVALVGAAGAIGKSIAAALRAEGRPYRVIGRSRDALDRAFGQDPLAEVTTWNPADPASVRQALAGTDAAVHLVGVPYDKFEQHPIVMRQVIEGAVAAGVERLLQIGTVYPFGMARTPTIAEDHPREPHTYRGRMRKAQEDLTLAAHADGRIQTTILRLPDFYGPDGESSFLHGTFTAALAGKRALMVGPIDRPHEFVFTPDVGPVVGRLLRTADAFGRTWNLAGAGVITQRAFARKIFAAAGTKPRLLPVGKRGLSLFGLFDPVMKGLAEMNYLVTDPLLLNDNALAALIGPLAKTSYDEGVARTLAALRSR